MDKKINQIQIDTVLQTFYDVNPPIKVYLALQKFFKDLPVVEEPMEVTGAPLPENPED